MASYELMDANTPPSVFQKLADDVEVAPRHSRMCHAETRGRSMNSANAMKDNRTPSLLGDLDGVKDGRPISLSMLPKAEVVNDLLGS